MNDTIVYNACPLHFTYLETFFIVFSIKLPFYALFSNASINIQKVCLKYHSKLNVQLNVCLVAGITMLIWGWRKMLSIKPVFLTDKDWESCIPYIGCLACANLTIMNFSPASSLTLPICEFWKLFWL